MFMFCNNIYHIVPQSFVVCARNNRLKIKAHCPVDFNLLVLVLTD